MSKRKRSSEEIDGHAKSKKSKKSNVIDPSPEAVEPINGGAAPTIVSSEVRETEEKQEAVPKKKKAKKLKVEKQEKNGVKASPTIVGSEMVEAMEEQEVAAKEKKAKKLRVEKHEQNELEVEREKRLSEWTLSEPCGGRLLDIDPIVSQDEQHLLMAYPSAIKVYDSKNSLLERTLSTSKSSHVTAFALSPTDPSKLFVSLLSGRVEKWDWMEGRRVTKWDMSSQIHQLSVANLPDEKDKESHEIVFVVDSDDKEQWMVTAHHFRPQSSESKSEVRTLFTTEEPISSLQVIENGLFIVATAGRRVIMGSRRGRKCSPLKTLYYKWREIECPKSIVCVHSRATSLPDKSERPPLDIIVGSDEGAMFLYRDIITQLDLVEQRKSGTPPVNRLHWHRNAVGSVKWSADGNYVISGGMETGLVLWQLDTGKKQFLPHLSSAIESIVVSPAGSSYVVRLADNSAMVLSTTELKPTFNTSGTQLQQFATSPFSQSQPESARAPQNLFPVRRCAVTRISRSSRLLFAVPATVSSRSGARQSQSSPYLQTIDSRSGEQISKQALARTQVTDRNTGPEGNFIEEPNVVLLSVSHDGKWLATVDEWIPPAADVQHLIVDKEEKDVVRMRSLETYLKFWSWSEESDCWELVWRVDNPHKANGDAQGFGLVLDLIEDPSRAGFFTVGDDRVIKIWRPRARLRNSSQVQDKLNKPLANWACQEIHALPLTGKWDQSLSLPIRMCVSLDGSLLAVACESGESPHVSMFNSKTLKLVSSRFDLFKGSLIGVGLIGRFLVVLSSVLTVWDIVDDRWVYSYNFHRPPQFSDEQLVTSMHIAFDQHNETFAVGIPASKSKTKLATFRPEHPSPLSIQNIPQLLRAVLPTPSIRSEFTAVDCASQIRTLVASATPTFHTTAVEEEGEREETGIQAPAEIGPLTSGLENIFGKGKRLIASPAQDNSSITATLTLQTAPPPPPSSTTTALAIEADSATGARQQQQLLLPQLQQQDELSKIFNASQPLTLPPAVALFEQVAAALSRANRSARI